MEERGSTGSVERRGAGRSVDRFLVDGRLVRSPRRLRDRELVVRYLAAQVLPLEDPVTELTLTRRLAERADDPVAVRRAMVDAGLVHRTRDGSAYWRTVVTEFDDLPSAAD